MTAREAPDRVGGAGEAHRDEETYGFGDREFRRPFNDSDPTAVEALINAHFDLAGLPRRDWTLLAPLRPGEAIRDRLTLAIAPELALELMAFLASNADVAPTRSGKHVRARLRPIEVRRLMAPPYLEVGRDD